jgi:hypothetical protein
VGALSPPVRAGSRLPVLEEHDAGGQQPELDLQDTPSVGETVTRT